MRVVLLRYCYKWISTSAEFGLLSWWLCFGVMLTGEQMFINTCTRLSWCLVFHPVAIKIQNLFSGAPTLHTFWNQRLAAPWIQVPGHIIQLCKFECRVVLPSPGTNGLPHHHGFILRDKTVISSALIRTRRSTIILIIIIRHAFAYRGGCAFAARLSCTTYTMPTRKKPRRVRQWIRCLSRNLFLWTK